MVDKKDMTPTVYFQHMNTKMLAGKEMVDELLKFGAERLRNMAHNYAMASPNGDLSLIGIVHNLDVYKEDLGASLDELKELYSDEYIDALSSTKEDIEKSFNALMDTLFSHWKTDTIRLMLYEDKCIKSDSFQSIIYSILQEHYNIKHQMVFQRGTMNNNNLINEYAYIIQQKESES